jgi:hypothetical protein
MRTAVDPEILLACGGLFIWGLAILGMLWLSNPVDREDDDD